MKKLLALLFLLPFLASAQVNITNITHAAVVTTNDFVLGITNTTTRLLPVSGIVALAGSGSGTVTTNVFVAAGANIAVAEANSGTNRTYTVSGSSYQNISNIFAGTFDVRDFGAVADCVQLTNATMVVGDDTLTCANATFVVGDVGKHVQVVDGMDVGVNLCGTITALVDPNNVTISETCSNTPSGQVFYGTENALPFQLAFNAAATNGFGGAVYAESGYYLFDREWQSNPGTAVAGSSKVQITMPEYRGISGTNMAIRLFGNIPPAIGGFPRTDNPINVAGSVIVCARTAYDTTNYTIIGTPTPYVSFGFNYVRLALENLTFRTQRDGRICPLNLRYNASVKLENVHVDVGWTGQCLTNTAPRYSSYGVIFPGVNNDIQSWVNNVRVAGFGTGMVLGECASYDQLTSVQCVTGYELETMWHGLHVNYGYAINCATGIVAKLHSGVSPPPTLQIHWAMFESEDNSSGGWDDLQYEVFDPNSLLYGDMYFSSSGLASTRVPVVYGGTNLTLHLPGQGVYNNMYSFGRFSNNDQLSLYLGNTRAGALPNSDSVTYANATLTADRATGDTYLNAKSGAIKFYVAMAGDPKAAVDAYGLTLRSNAQFSVTAPDVRLWNSNGLSLWLISATATNFLGGTEP